jgi:hypothetical protein
MSVVRKLVWIVAMAVLFIALTPGVLLTIPAPEGKGILTVGEAPWAPVLVHAGVFAAVYGLIKLIMWGARKVRGRRSSSSAKSSSAASSTKK